MELNGEKKHLKDEQTEKGKKDRKQAIAIVALVLIVIILIIVLIVVATAKVKCEKEKETKQATKKQYMSCKNDKITIDPKFKDETNVFRHLDNEELQSIVSYISKQFVIRPKKPMTPVYNLSYIQNIELYVPNKKDALGYLDNGKAKPKRNAIVTIVKGPDTITFYVVGPLPKPTYHELAKFNDRKNPMPYVPNPHELLFTPRFNEISKECLTRMWEIFRNTYEKLEKFKTAEDAIKGGVTHWDAMTNKQVEGEIHTTMIWRYLPDKISNRHLDFMSVITVMINVTSKVDEEWKIFQVFYNLESYRDIQELVDKYNAGKLKIRKVKALSKEDYEKTIMKKRGSQNNYYPSMEPVIAAPNGPRFSIKGDQITYLDWQMNYIVQSASGPALFDVRYKNERIAFEVSLQEASSMYSSGESFLQSVAYLDSNYFLSISSPLTKGIDCPFDAVYLDAVVFLYFEIKTIKNAICIFEQTTSIPLRRHRHSISDDVYRYGGLADASLVIRFITDIYNYDYLHDFVFHQNGVLEVKTSTSGYLLMPQYYEKNQEKYGYETAPGYAGSIHDHFIMYKVDLDILGTKNSFKTLDYTTQKFADPWDPYPTMKKFITGNKRKTELDAFIKYNFDKPKYYIIYNENSTNRYGNVRGYRILIQNPVKQVYPDDHRGTKADEWSKYQLVISKFKETERYGSCMFNFFPQYKEPRCSFDALINDNENIENEDLVAWVPIGGPHIPSAEDYPLTPTIGNQFTFFLKPFNYFDEDPSYSSANNVFIQEVDGCKNVETYETPEEGTCGLPKRSFK